MTNLLAQVGDYTTVGQNKISVVDPDSFWVDGYFEETNLHSIRVGDPATIKLMGYGQSIRGHVDSIAHGINVAMRSRIKPESPRSTRSSPGCASRSEFRCASTSIGCPMGCTWCPA